MASQEQDHAAALEEINRQYQELGRLLPQQQAAVDAAATGITGFSVGVDVAKKAATGLASAFTSGMKAMYDGQKGMKAFDGAVDGAADALMALTGALALLGGPITLLAAGLTAVVAAGAKYVKAANEQSDKLYDAYQQMANAGAAAGDGLQGLYNDVKRLGGGMQDLGDFVSLVAASSRDLASFSGTVGQGRRDMAKLSHAMKPYRESLMNAGISQKEQNESIATYIRLQSRVGLVQNKTMGELADSAHKYLMEQDQLTKLTGLTRKEQEDARQKARSRETFAATLVTLRAKGDKASLEAANKLEKTYTVLQQHSQELGDGFLDLTTGNLQSEAAQKLHIATQGEATRVANELKNGMISEGEALDRIRDALKRNVDTYGASQGAMQNYNKTFGDLSGTVSFVSAGMKGFQKSINAAGRTQKEQGLFGDKALDAEVQRQTELRLTQVNTMQNMQDFVRRGVGPATKATSFFSRVLEKTSKLFKGSDSLSKEFDAEKDLENREEKVSAQYEKMLEAGAKVDAAVTDIEKEAAEKELEAAKLAFKTATEEREASKERLRKIRAGEAEEPEPPRQPTGRTQGQNMAGFAQRGGLTAKEAQTLLDSRNERDIKAFGGRELLEKIAQGQQQAAPAPATPAPAPAAPAPAQPTSGGAAFAGPSRGRRKPSGLTSEEAARAANKMDQQGAAPSAPAPAPAAPAAPAAAPAATTPKPPSAPPMAPGQGEHPPATGSPPSAGQGPSEKEKLGKITSKSGKSAVVSQQYVPAFQGLIDYLDGVGYNIYSLGGYADRQNVNDPSRKSIHAFGGAIDINPATNPNGSRLITDMPEGIGDVAKSLGLGWGGNWKSVKDAMHFSVAKREGGDKNLPAFGDGGIVGRSTIAKVGEKGAEAIIPLKNGAVPVAMPKEFMEGIAKYQFVIDQVKDKFAENNVSAEYMQEAEKIKAKAMEAAGSNAEALLTAFKQMSEELKAQGEANRSVFESMLRAQETNNDISGKMLAAAQ